MPSAASLPQQADRIALAGGGTMEIAGNSAVSSHPVFGSFALAAPMLAKWHALAAEATADGSSVQDYLGSAIGDATASVAGSQMQLFERGMIVARKDGGVWVVYGAIYLRYRQLAGPNGFLGLPVSDEGAAGGARRSVFDRGEIIWSAATGAHAVIGAILQRYGQLGGAAGVLGPPTSDEQPVMHGGKQVGRFNTFQNGGIWFSDATGAWEVYGAIGALWRDTYGGPTGALGFPTSGETATPDAGGRFNEFSRGIVVWHPSGPYAGAIPVFDLEFFLDHFESNFDPYHVQVKVHFSRPDSEHDRWVPSESDFATNPRALWAANTPLVRHDTAVTVWLDGLGHHAIGHDERLGTFQARFDITNLWGLLDHTNPHPANGDHNKDFHFNTVFSMRTTLPGALGPFRRTVHWWPYHNFDTAVLSYDQMAQTYTDVHEDETTLWHPFDDRFYNWLYRTSAAKGNCFGMCVEALYARHNISLFSEPIFNNPLIQYPPLAAAGQKGLDPAQEPDDARLIAPVNIKFGYQFGDTVVDWLGGKLLGGGLSDPVAVFHETQAQYDAGDWPILSLTKGGIGSDGHAVVPYRWDTGSKPWRIFVANPNSPASSFPADDDPSNIVSVDPSANTFKWQKNATEAWTGGQSGDGMILSVPFPLLADEPSTPFWEVAALLAAATLIIIMGDGDTAQISDGTGKTFFGDARMPRSGSARSINANPATRLAGVAPMLLFNPQNPAAPFQAYRIGRPPPFRRAGQSAPVADHDARALQVIHQVAPGRSGTYEWMMRGPAGSFHAAVAGEASADTVTVDNLARAGQRVTLATAARTAKQVTLTVTGGQSGTAAAKAFTLSKVPMLAGPALSVATESAGQTLVVHNLGPAVQFGLQLQAGAKATAQPRPAVQVEAGKAVRFTPKDWSPNNLPHAPITMERLDGPGGRVLETAQI